MDCVEKAGPGWAGLGRAGLGSGLGFGLGWAGLGPGLGPGLGSGLGSGLGWAGVRAGVWGGLQGHRQDVRSPKTKCAKVLNAVRTTRQRPPLPTFVRHLVPRHGQYECVGQAGA